MPRKCKIKRQKYNKNYFKEWYEKNKDYAKGRVAQRKKELKEWFKEYKSTLKCKNCEENHPATLDFHHRDGEIKECNVSMLVVNNYSKEHISQEIAKCEVLCANCHRKLHWDNS